jgi:hypothetical protein
MPGDLTCIITLDNRPKLNTSNMWDTDSPCDQCKIVVSCYCEYKKLVYSCFVNVCTRMYSVSGQMGVVTSRCIGWMVFNQLLVVATATTKWDK